MTPVEFPEKLNFLFQPHRYKVIYGGRGGTKSWACSMALLLLGINKKIRVLCAREVQNSIRDSVHRVLKDQIVRLGLTSKYEVLEQTIRGSNGTEFLFSGLATHTVTSIKSFEGCDICWVEEGQTISNRSWNILTPTIRKEDSEIWISFNPELETDPTYERFVKNPPENSVVVKLSWRDNPWFNAVLQAERLHCLRTNPTDYLNIWEGECKVAVEGAIFFEELQAMRRSHRIRNVPYDSMLSAHVVFDLGFGDAMAVSIVQRMTSEIRVIWYREFIREKLSTIASELRGLKYNWGKVWLPHADGFSKTSKGQDSAEEIMKKQGWVCAKKSDVSSLGIEDGIRITRERFPRFYIDEKNCERLIECLVRYRRSINQATLQAGAPMHDAFSHGGDNLRYIATNADSMTNHIDKPRPYIAHSYGALDVAVGY